MTIKNRNVKILSKDYQSTDRMKNFMVMTAGLKLCPVQGDPDAYWVSGDSRGDYNDGPKYYKIVFGTVTQTNYVNGPDGYQVKQERTGSGFDCQASGDLNAWSMLASWSKLTKEWTSSTLKTRAAQLPTDLKEESRMVFRNKGFVMIYTVVSEMSRSVPIPLSPL